MKRDRAGSLDLYPSQHLKGRGREPPVVVSGELGKKGGEKSVPQAYY